MDTRAPLLGLPDDLLSGALSRFCSAIALARLAATCARLRELCKQAAEVLLEEVGAAATTVAARVAGASTLRNLALLCGRAPLITERFYEYVQKRLDGRYRTIGFRYGVRAADVCIDWAALQLLFVAFGDVDVGGWTDTWDIQSTRGNERSRINYWDSTIDATLSRALDCMQHGQTTGTETERQTTGRDGRQSRRSFFVQPSVACLRACHVLQALGICYRWPAFLSRLIDWRSSLQDLSSEDAPDDDPSPSANFDEHVSEPPEEFEDDVGVVIDDQWYGRKEDFFDLPDNFPGDPDEEDGPCDQGEGCCHNASCWVEHGCMCMSAGHVFDRARRLQMHNGSGSCEDQGNVDLAAHFVSSKLWRRIRTPCPAAGRKVAWLARHAAWRREGQANAAATLAALGVRVVEGVPFGEGPPFEACFRGGSLECPELLDAERA